MSDLFQPVAVAIKAVKEGQAVDVEALRSAIAAGEDQWRAERRRLEAARTGQPDLLRVDLHVGIGYVLRRAVDDLENGDHEAALTAFIDALRLNPGQDD